MSTILGWALVIPVAVFLTFAVGFCWYAWARWTFDWAYGQHYPRMAFFIWLHGAALYFLLVGLGV